jgi:hypothetical protein
VNLIAVDLAVDHLGLSAAQDVGAVDSHGNLRAAYTNASPV